MPLFHKWLQMMQVSVTVIVQKVIYPKVMFLSGIMKKKKVSQSSWKEEKACDREHVLSNRRMLQPSGCPSSWHFIIRAGMQHKSHFP